MCIINLICLSQVCVLYGTTEHIYRSEWLSKRPKTTATSTSTRLSSSTTTTNTDLPGKRLRKTHQKPEQKSHSQRLNKYARLLKYELAPPSAFDCYLLVNYPGVKIYRAMSLAIFIFHDPVLPSETSLCSRLDFKLLPGPACCGSGHEVGIDRRWQNVTFMIFDV